MARSFVGTFIRAEIWGVVSGEGDFEDDVVYDVFGSLSWVERGSKVSERTRGNKGIVNKWGYMYGV